MICASVGAFGFTVIMLFVAAFSGESAAAALADGTKLLFWFYVIAATTWLLCFALEIKIARIIAAAEKKPPPPFGATLAGGITARLCAIIGAFFLMAVTTAAANFGAWDKSVLATGIIFLLVGGAIASGTKVLNRE
ncbi:MAG: hypothetical protein AAB560_01675 [Patescibacteria group bacterium]